METERLEQIFEKTNGHCHICSEKVYFSGYGNTWEIEHSIPKAKGGTDHLNNLFPAHLSCNRSKGTKHTRTARAEYGNTRAPYHKKKIEDIKNGNTVTGAVIGGLLGAFLGPEGAIIGASIGAAIGRGTSPNK